jgi:steroid delta-isomerase-like uncharacterized protein
MGWYQDYADAWNRRDADRIASCFTDEGTYEDFATGRRHEGRAAIEAWVTSIIPEFSSDYTFEFAEPASLTDEGYAVEWVMRGTHDGQTGPVPATGKSYEIHGVSVGTLQGGKIASNRDYWSLAEFLVQVGILPPLMPSAS